MNSGKTAGKVAVRKEGRPPVEEVRALWAACLPPSADTAGDLQARGLDPALVWDVLRLWPASGSDLVWARSRGKSWGASGHRWLVPLYDHKGELASLHARALAPGPDPIALSPTGYKLKGLVMADPRGMALLQDGTASSVVICEGVPDFLTCAALWGDAAEDAPAVLGVIVGCWSRDLAARIPKDAQVTIWTDPKYASQVAATLYGRGRRVSVVRQEIPEGANDILRRGGAGAVLAVLQGAAAPEQAWQNDLLRDSKGLLLKVEANATLLLERDPKWAGVLAYNEFARRVEFRQPPPWHAPERPKAGALAGAWTDDDATRVQGYLQRAHGLKLPPTSCERAVRIAAQQQGLYHPIREYLEGLRWDGIPRLVQLFARYFGAAGPHLPLVSLWWPISAVARVMRPGCQVDYTIILEGAQSLGKSSALRALCGNDEWFYSSHIDIKNKDAMIALEGAWIINIDEFSSFKRAEQEAVKTFLTERVDKFRPVYGRATTKAPRSCVFAATTNKETYLEDPTGGRRFWPVGCTLLDLEGLGRDRDQLWAEALHLYLQGHQWWPSTPEEHALLSHEQEARYEADVWEPQIAAWLQDWTGQGLALALLLEKAIGVRLEQQGRAEQGRVGSILRRLGWEMIPTGPKRQRLWWPKKEPAQPPLWHILSPIAPLGQLRDPLIAT